MAREGDQLHRFSGTRARFQRLRDAKFFSGWIQELTPGAAILTSQIPLNLVEGDDFAFQVYGHKQSVTFRAKVTHIAAPSYVFAIGSELSFSDSIEHVRKQVTSYPCVVERANETVIAMSIDVSIEGIGIRSPKQLDRHERVTIRVNLPAGIAEAHGQVRYCKPAEGAGGYRAGLALEFHDRVSRARWTQLIEQAA